MVNYLDLTFSTSVQEELQILVVFDWIVRVLVIYMKLFSDEFVHFAENAQLPTERLFSPACELQQEYHLDKPTMEGRLRDTVPRDQIPAGYQVPQGHLRHRSEKRRKIPGQHPTCRPPQW